MTALALADHDQREPGQLAALRQTGIDEDISEAELQVFLHECQRRKLDPFSRQIYLIGRWNKAKKRKEYRSQTGIDGFRVIARRAADTTGIEYSYEDTLWFDGNGRAYQAWVTRRLPPRRKSSSSATASVSTRWPGSAPTCRPTGTATRPGSGVRCPT